MSRTAVPEKELTRQQRRMKERIEKEANQTFTNFTERYFQHFVESSDPEGEAMTEIFHRMNAQWITYCHRKNLINDAQKMFAAYAEVVLNDYRKNKNQVPESV